MGIVFPLYELLIFGGIWFWVFITIMSLLLIASVEREDYSFATGSLIFTIVILLFFGTGIKELLIIIKDNPLATIGCIIGYIIIGTIYSIIKWRLFVYDTFRLNQEVKQDWIQVKLPEMIAGWKYKLNANGAGGTEQYKLQLKQQQEEIKNILPNFDTTEWTQSKQEAWKKYEREYHEYDRWRLKHIRIIKPEPEENKEKIIGWIAYWPPSMLWTLLNDPLRRIGNEIYYFIARYLKSISDNAWKE